jgi:hypothetical protein
VFQITDASIQVTKGIIVHTRAGLAKAPVGAPRCPFCARWITIQCALATTQWRATCAWPRRRY